MPQSRVVLCVIYGAIAVIALAATWSQNVAYLGGGLGGFFTALGAFVLDTKANPASRSITVDIGLFFLAAALFMVLEARKHGIRFVWAYILGGLLIAISVTFPLFLIAREIRLAAGGAQPTLGALDSLLLAAFAALILGLTYFVGFT